MDIEITPFTIAIDQTELDDLHHRLAQTRWPAPLPTKPGQSDWHPGVPLPYLQELAEYWRTGYDWRAAEAELNQWPGFTTTIDGTNVHFLHVRSPEASAVPMLLTHGWPGSIGEFLDVLGPLTDPAAHGGDPRDAFHVVVPSIPGYGFSGPTPDAGWDVERIAAAWRELMTRLGYDRFGAQGGDWGSGITLEVGRQAPERVIGAHINTVNSYPAGDPQDDDEQARLARLDDYHQRLSGYMHIQARRPMTLAYGLTDSPIGQLAWIMDMFGEWTGTKGEPEKSISRDHMLTDVMLYWLTRTAGSSSMLYAEQFSGWGRGRPAPLTAPVGVALFTQDNSLPVRRMAEPYLGNVVRWNEFPDGGHFAALEQPETLVGEVRAFFRDLRA